jgi:drug/metabolite transporter (DMT)-like permease
MMNATGQCREVRQRFEGSRLVPFVALTVLALIWSYSWVVVKVGLRYSPPLTFAALRNMLGALILFVLMIATRRSLRPKAFRWILVIGLLQTTGFFGLSALALETGGAGRVTVLTYTMPFWLLFLAWVFLGEKLRGLQWLAVAMAFAGLLLIVAPWELRGVGSSLLALGTAVCWAGSAVAVKMLQARQRIDLLSLASWQMLLGALPLAVIALLTSTEAPQWSAPLIWSLVYTTVLATAPAQLLWLYILRSMSAGYAGLSMLAVPVLTVAFAWLQLGERPSSAVVMGMLLIVSGLGIITAREVRMSRSASPPADLMTSKALPQSSHIPARSIACEASLQPTEVLPPGAGEADAD